MTKDASKAAWLAAYFVSQGSGPGLNHKRNDTAAASTKVY
jgi:hypothetical protein